jgi:DNA-binding CsgD family transcriptional regulator
MTASFSWRKTRATDLADCLELHPAKNGSEIVGKARAAKAWQELLGMSHATRSAVIEKREGKRVELVGFGLASFVRKSFAEDEVRNPRPGLNSRIIASVADGCPVVATEEEVREANTRGDLQQVIPDTSWKNGGLTAAQVDEVRVLLSQAYMQLFAGYRFSRILVELVDELDAWHVRGQRFFRVIDRYEDFHRANPGSPWNRDRSLVEVTREGFHENPHSTAAVLFQHHVQPEFPFTQREQELLELALEGEDDVSIAKSLFVTLPAVKRRWSNIFACVGAIRPELCPMDGDGTRGIQKRQRILAYVRNHPEELRPFLFDAKKRRKRNPGTD